MPQLRSDVVEVFVVRWRNGQIETLLGKRKSQQPIGSIWQPFSTRIDASESTIEAAKRAVSRGSGLQASEFYAVDRTHQFFDAERDALVIAPVLAAAVHATSARAGVEFDAVDWQDAPTAQGNLFIAGHREALHRIVELLGPSGAALDLYRIL